MTQFDDDEEERARLIQERDAAQGLIRAAQDMLTELELYLTSSKFAAPDCDYVYVRTDILPKIMRVRLALIEGRFCTGEP